MAFVILAIAEPLTGSASGLKSAPSSEATFKVRVYGLASDGVAPPPAPTPTPAPTAQPVVRENRTVEEIICSFDWPCSEALAVARCESGLNPNAYNPSGASGLFQLLMRFHRWRLHGASEFDPQANAAAAFSLWLEQGWAPWDCRP